MWVRTTAKNILTPIPAGRLFSLIGKENGVRGSIPALHVKASGKLYANAGATFSQNSSRERLILSSGNRSPALNSRTIPLS